MVKLTVAVVSDIHATQATPRRDPESGDRAASHVFTEPPDNQPLRDPVASLYALIEADKLRADFLVSAGDMGDRASPAGVRYAWKQINGFAEALGCSRVYGTAGNHDMDSRFKYTNHDARALLLDLDPPFPVNSQGEEDDLSAANSYWARNYVIQCGQNYRIVILNSAAYHGYEQEWQHGRISSGTIARLRQELEGQMAPPINILLCHHHPLRFGDIDLEDYSEMEGGQELLELLRHGEFGRWTVIHGHKHYARITYGPGGAFAPLILSAGSLGADLYGELSNRSRNQFYLLSYDLDATRDVGLALAGTFRAWNWAPNLGWRRATGDVALPHEGGFGYIPEIPASIDSLETFLEQAQGEYATWGELVQHDGRLAYLLPEDHLAIVRELEQRPDVEVLAPEGRIVQVRKAR